MTNKTRVYIVFKEAYTFSEFVGCFFDKSAAEEWIAGRKHPHVYRIEIHEQREGIAEEVCD